MNITKLLSGGIAGAVAFFLLGWLFYGVLLMDFMASNPGVVGNIGKEEPNFMYLIIGNIAQGLLLAYIFIKANITSVTSGLITGLIIGFLLSVSFDCIMYATTNIISRKAMAADVAAASVMTAIAGAVVAMIIGMGKKVN